MSALLVLIVTSLWPASGSLPRTRNLTALNVSENFSLSVALLAPSLLPVCFVCLFFSFFFTLDFLVFHIIWCFLFSKVLAARVSSLLRIAIGTMIASNALAATWHWLEKDSSPMVLISCVPSAPNSAFFKWTKFFFLFKLFFRSNRPWKAGRGKTGKFLIWFFFSLDRWPNKKNNKENNSIVIALVGKSVHVCLFLDFVDWSVI